MGLQFQMGLFDRRVRRSVMLYSYYGVCTLESPKLGSCVLIGEISDQAYRRIGGGAVRILVDASRKATDSRLSRLSARGRIVRWQSCRLSIFPRRGPLSPQPLLAPPPPPPSSSSLGLNRCSQADMINASYAHGGSSRSMQYIRRVPDAGLGMTC